MIPNCWVRQCFKALLPQHINKFGCERKQLQIKISSWIKGGKNHISYYLIWNIFLFSTEGKFKSVFGGGGGGVSVHKMHNLFNNIEGWLWYLVTAPH